PAPRPAAGPLGPDPVRPHIAVPAQFAPAAGPPPAPAGTAVAFDDAFLQGLGDPLLSELVEEALHANHDLRIALTRVDRANALLRGARSEEHTSELQSREKL